MMKHLCTAIFLIVCCTSLAHAQYSPEWEALKKHNPAPGWFANAKLGIYFHWGVYSVPAWGSEWYPRWMYVPDRVGWGEEIFEYHKRTYGEHTHYHDFIPQWKADKFDAAQWVDLFEEMGARFIGCIAEHHDGFSLWDSEVNPWNSAEMGPGIDVVRAIGEEAQKRDLKYMTTFHHGFHMMFYPKPENSWLRPVSRHNLVYDSVEVPQADKFRKLYNNMHYDEANDYWLAKLNEVIEAHCPDYIWMDFGQRFIKESHRKQFLANYFNKAAELNKEVVVNTKGTFFPTDLAVVNVERASMGEIMPEVWITDFILGSAWCYNQAKRTAIDPHKAVRMLADVVSKNGIMLLSAGPMADGTIPEEQVRAMKGIGAWMSRYGEAIYETRPFVTFGEGPTEIKKDEKGSFKTGLNELNKNDVRYTRKGDVVYAIQLGWPGEKTETVLSTFANEAKDLKVSTVSVLGSDERIKWKRISDGLVLRSPGVKPVEADAALVYKIEISGR